MFNLRSRARNSKRQAPHLRSPIRPSPRPTKLNSRHSASRWPPWAVWGANRTQKTRKKIRLGHPCPSPVHHPPAFCSAADSQRSAQLNQRPPSVHHSIRALPAQPPHRSLRIRLHSAVPRCRPPAFSPVQTQVHFPNRPSACRLSSSRPRFSHSQPAHFNRLAA